MASEMESNRLYHIESHGIDIIPDGQRQQQPRQLFWNWAAANFAMGNLVLGAFLPYLGLTVWQALTVLLVADGFVGLFALCSLYGPRFGTSTMVASRAVFGIRGNFIPTLLTWIEAVGWEAVNTVLGVLVVVAVIQKMSPHVNSNLVTAIMLAVMIAGTLIWALLGHATIMHLQRYTSVILIIGFILMFILVLSHGVLAHVAFAHRIAPLAANNWFGAWLIGLMLLASGAPYGWANFSAEYSRYLKADAAPRKVVGSVFWGFVIVFNLTVLLGIVLAVALHASDPVTALPQVLPLWFLVPFALIIVIGLFSANVLNAYTSGLTLQAIGIKLERYKTVLFDMVLVTLAAIYALYVYNFTSSFEAFLGLMIAWVAPWMALFIYDYYQDRGPHQPELLFAQQGRYWYTGGVRWKTLVSFMAGLVIALLFLNDYPLFVGPLTAWFAGGDFSIFSGSIVSLAVYVIWGALEQRNARASATPVGPAL